MIVGLPASGKSTLAGYFENNGYFIHSSDALREELYGDESIQDDNKSLFLELHSRIKKDLLNNKNVVYDATNLSRKRRMAFLKYINDINCQKICIVMATPFEQCLEQNKNRSRVVPEEVIYNMRKKLLFSCIF